MACATTWEICDSYENDLTILQGTDLSADVGNFLHNFVAAFAKEGLEAAFPLSLSIGAFVRLLQKIIFIILSWVILFIRNHMAPKKLTKVIFQRGYTSFHCFLEL